jgi:hypothetical protein
VACVYFPGARAVSGGCSPKYAAVADLPAHFYQATGQNSLPKGRRLSDYAIDAYKYVDTNGTYYYYGLKYNRITVSILIISSIDILTVYCKPQINHRLNMSVDHLFLMKYLRFSSFAWAWCT